MQVLEREGDDSCCSETGGTRRRDREESREGEQSEGKRAVLDSNPESIMPTFRAAP